MKTRTKIIFGVCGLLLLTLILFYRNSVCECTNRISYKTININDKISLNKIYAPADSIELLNITNSWNDFSPQSDYYMIVNKSAYYYDRVLVVIRHFTDETKHYGAVILPRNYDASRSYPALLWANGLDQSNPVVDIQNFGPLYKRLQDYFIIIPSYRGQALVANGRRYCSDGFFGDAFDGATDDALRLLEVAKTEFDGIDKKRVVVGGASRGGTVALLMGIRNNNINAVISMAAPTDFFSETMYNRYRKQYKYQFLSKKVPLKEIRAKMIKSSPIHFIENYPNHLLLIHGKNDKVVPVSHAIQVIEKLKEKEHFEYRLVNEGHSINYETEHIFKWLRTHN